MRVRLGLGAAGVLLGLFGVFRILTQVPGADILALLVWLAAAVILHDGILSPIIVGVGVGLHRVVPSRARRFLAPALVVGGLMSVIALPLIYRENSQPPSKAILQQNYGGNLTLLLGIVAAAALLGYIATLFRDHTGQRRSAAQESPPKGELASSGD